MWTPRYLAEVSLEGSAVEVVLCLYWSTFQGDGITLRRIELLFPFPETAKVGLERVGVMHGFDSTVQHPSSTNIQTVEQTLLWRSLM